MDQCHSSNDNIPQNYPTNYECQNQITHEMLQQSQDILTNIQHNEMVMDEVETSTNSSINGNGNYYGKDGEIKEEQIYFKELDWEYNHGSELEELMEIYQTGDEEIDQELEEELEQLLKEQIQTREIDYLSNIMSSMKH